MPAPTTTVVDSVSDLSDAEIVALAKQAAKNRDRAVDQYHRTQALKPKRRQRYRNAALRSAALLEFYLTIGSVMEESGAHRTTLMPRWMLEAAWRNAITKVGTYFREAPR